MTHFCKEWKGSTLPNSAAPRVNQNHNRIGVSDWVSDWYQTGYQTGIRLVSDCAATSQPDSHSARQPANQPVVQPASQRPSQPASQTASQSAMCWSVGALSPAAPAHQSPTCRFAREQARLLLVRRAGRQTGRRTDRPTKSILCVLLFVCLFLCFCCFLCNTESKQKQTKNNTTTQKKNKH